MAVIKNRGIGVERPRLVNVYYTLELDNKGFSQNLWKDFHGNSLKISGRVDLLWVEKISERFNYLFSVQSPFSVRKSETCLF